MEVLCGTSRIFPDGSSNFNFKIQGSRYWNSVLEEYFKILMRNPSNERTLVSSFYANFDLSHSK